MKNVAQLDESGFFVGLAVAENSPLEPDILHFPHNAIDQDAPKIPAGHKAKWHDGAAGVYGWEFLKKDAIEAPEPIIPKGKTAVLDTVATLQGDDWVLNWKLKKQPYVAGDLSPRRFEYLLAFTGLGDVWDAIQAELKTRDRAQFAQLAAQRRALSFSQVKTLEFVAMFRPVAAQVAPDVDLSDDAIKAAWIMAEGAKI
jgi:hypothetical protein